MMSVDEEAYASRDANMTKLRNALLAAESSEDERRAFSEDPHSYLLSKGVEDFICQVGTTQTRSSDINYQAPWIIP